MKFAKDLLIFLVFSLPLLATKYAGEPLELGFGARALGMGGSFTAVADDPAAVYWNPSGLVSIEPYSFLVQHSENFGGFLKVESGALAFGNRLIRSVSSGVGVYLLHSEGIEFTELKDTTDTVIPGNVRLKEKASYRFLTIFLAGAKKFSIGEAGVTFKLIHEDLGGVTGNGFGIDVGFKRDVSGISLALHLRDLFTTPIFWSTGREEYIMPSAVLGFGARLSRSFLFTGDLIFRFEGREGAAQFALPGPISLEYRVGSEVVLTDYFVLRAGVERGRPAFGAGVLYGRFSFDYAYLSHTDLGDSHRFSITGRI